MNMKSSVLFLFALCFAPICCDKNARIIVVGSGPSGTAAASKLMENGFNNVKILEAEDRRGGRVWTTKFGNYWVDMGGQWVHGDVDNIAYDLASPLGLVQKSEDYGEMEISEMHGSDGTNVSEEHSKKLFNYFIEISENMTDIDRLKTGSVGEYMTDRLNEFMLTMPELTEHKREEIIFFFNRLEGGLDSAHDWSQVSAKGAANYAEAGDRLVNWKDKGYSTILDILTKKIPNPEEELPVMNNTILNAKVTKINYGDDGPVKLSTADGKEYLADHVIFTCSLGVLKADHENLFTPPLPEKKVNAIKNIGFGTVAKIYLLYDEPWWKPERHFLKPMLWSREDVTKLGPDSLEYWMLGTFDIISVEHKPNLLCLWMSGEYSRKMEQVPEELFKNQTRDLVTKFFGKNYNVTDPKEIRRTTWGTNENFRGTYSYLSVDSDKFNATNENLAEPLMRNGKPIIQFAGEATSERQYGTVHGAIESGFREANRLIKLYSNRSSSQ